MATLSTSLMATPHLQRRSLSGCSLNPLEQQLFVRFSSRNSSLRSSRHASSVGLAHGRRLPVLCAYSDGERPISAGIFIGGFLLGGLIVGTLGCVYAPQISRTLAGTDKKDLMRRLPKFIYDEEKALEKTRKILTEKIAQLNSAIDDVSSQLRADYDPNGTATPLNEVEATR